MISEQSKQIILNLRADKYTFREIATIVGHKESAIKVFCYRKRLNEGLPPKVKKSRRMIDGRMGRLIKNLVSEDSRLSLRKLAAKLKEMVPEGIKYLYINIKNP